MSMAISDPLLTGGTLDMHQYSPEFERLWALRPRRKGPDNKRRAFKAYKARLRQGHDCKAIEDGMKRYSDYCDAEGKTDTRYVYQTCTFLGPDLHFLEPWETFIEPLPRKNEDLVAWGTKKGCPPRPGEEYKDYRKRLEGLV